MGARSRPQGLLRDHDHSRAGEGGDTLDIGEVTADDVNIDDDDTLDFGTDDDYGIRYDSGDTRLEFFSAAQGDFMRVADGGIAVVFPGDVTVQGTTTEVDDILTTDVFVEQTDGTDQIHLSGDTTPHFIRDLVGGMEIRGDDDNARVTLAAGQTEMRDETGTLVASLSGGSVTFDNITGTPTMANHDHSEGGMTVIPAGGLDLTMSPTWTGQHTWDGAFQTIQRAEPGAGAVRLLALGDTTSSDELRFRLTTAGVFRLSARDSSAGTTRNIYDVDPASQQMDMLATLNFSNITGTPTFAGHDHSSGGMTTIPPAGLATPYTDLSTLFGSPVTAGANIGMGGNAINGDDGFEIIFGTGDDMDVTFVSGNDALEWSDRGTSTRMQLDRTSGNLNIEGSLTEGAAL